jgi:hypothetical protein
MLTRILQQNLCEKKQGRGMMDKGALEVPDCH